MLLLSLGETLDFRGNEAYRIADDGHIDIRDVPGAPTTLTALDGYFNPPETDAPTFGRSAPSSRSAPGLIALGLILVAAAIAWRRLARNRR